jgi:hypothetical protein
LSGRRGVDIAVVGWIAVTDITFLFLLFFFVLLLLFLSLGL